MNKSEKTILIAFKGFSDEDLPNKERKFFSKWDKLILDKINLVEIKTQILPQIFDSMSRKEEYFWLTYEELILSYDQIKLNFDIKILDNNLYNKQYPYQGLISDIETIFTEYFLHVDEAIENKKNEEFAQITEFYGDINFSKDSGRYYVVYRELDVPKETQIPLHKIGNFNVIVNDSINIEGELSIELSDNEVLFLDITNDLLEGIRTPRILNFIVTSDIDILPNRYRDRIEILQEFLKDRVKITFSTKSIVIKDIPNLKEYEGLLKKYWGYEHFRNLEIYKDIENKEKKIAKISQAQIINDIVEQAVAAFNNDDYKDIYITSATGSGKSVMFQIPSLYLSERYADKKPLVIIISPLIGLMNDQVDSMVLKGIKSARTIHSNTAPYEREKILQEVADGTITMLYISPETLQSRADVKMLIGDRQISLLIVDEAHIVTTWGKTFRADYWYLGIYLQKLRKEYRFPIVTFTATAIYGGKEDMYLDTRDSLNMVNPISYFGNVRREDIFMCVRSSEDQYDRAGRDYRKTKNQLALDHLQYAFKKNEKSLIYFPTIKLLTEFYRFVQANNKKISEVTKTYYGTMLKEEKDEVLSSYKNGDIQFVLATKAFGMGIDIPDITNVYHYTPTGNVIDYIQEIGRVARDKDKVKHGFAWFDFLANDFAEVNKLQGMSAVRKEQILEVMKKILSIYQEKGNNRNLVVSADDFRHIFNDQNDDQNNLDNKIKTILLMIEKDFSSPKRLGYSPFVARPRSIFGNETLFVSKEFEKIISQSPLKRYFQKKANLQNSLYQSVYTINLTGVWETFYKNLSFPQFKYMLFTPEERKKLQHSTLFDQFVYAIGISIPKKDKQEVANILRSYDLYLNAFERFATEKKRNEKFFTIKELGTHIQRELRISDVFAARTISQMIINACFEFQKLKNYRFIKEIPTQSSESLFKLTTSFDVFISFMKIQIDKFYNHRHNFVEDEHNFTVYHFRSKNNPKVDEALIALGLGESIGLINYEVISGNNPQIYIRINSVYPLERAIKDGAKYRNYLLEDVNMKHRMSVAMLTYLFKYKASGNKPSEIIMNYTNFFWEQIENYFLGQIPDEVQEAVFTKKSNGRS